MNRTIKNVTEDIEDMDMKFNTCVSEIMIFVNEISRFEVIPKELIIALYQAVSALCAASCRRIVEQAW